MSELYTVLADPENAEIFTLIAIILLSFAYLSFLWGNANRLGNEFSTFQWGIVYTLGAIIFGCCVIILGKFVFPQNIDYIMGLFGISTVLHYITVRCQEVVLAMLRALM